MIAHKNHTLINKIIRHVEASFYLSQLFFSELQYSSAFYALAFYSLGFFASHHHLAQLAQEWARMRKREREMNEKTEMGRENVSSSVFVVRCRFLFSFGFFTRKKNSKGVSPPRVSLISIYIKQK